MIEKERVTIDKQDIKKLIESIGYDDLKVLRAESTRELSRVRLQDRIKFCVYLPKEYVEKFEQARDWAFEKRLIKKKTRWAFTKLCVVNVMTRILEEKAKEQLIAQQS